MQYFVTNPDANTHINNIYQRVKQGMNNADIAEALNNSRIKNLQAKGEWTEQQVEQIISNFNLNTETPLTITEEAYKEEQKKNKPSIILIILSTIIAAICILLSYSTALAKGLTGGELVGYTLGLLFIPLLAVLFFQIFPSFRNNKSRVKVIFWTMLVVLLLSFGQVAKRVQSIAQVEPSGTESLDSIIENARNNEATLEESLAAIDRLHEQQAASLHPIEEVIEKAEQGDVEAQLDLAERYTTGTGIEKDWQQGYDWYLKAAEQNNAEAQSWIASAYDSGWISTDNLEERITLTLEWYTKAAKNCSHHSQSMLGSIYQDGEIGLPPVSKISPDIEQSLYWHKRAAMNKNGASMSQLGLMLTAGQLTEQDKVTGLAWHYVSNAIHGKGVYAEQFENIAKTMPAKEIDQAKAKSQQLLDAVNNHQCKTG